MTKKEIQEFAKSQGMKVGGEVYGRMDSEAKELLIRAISRAKANKRNLIMGRDF